MLQLWGVQLPKIYLHICCLLVYVRSGSSKVNFVLNLVWHNSFLGRKRQQQQTNKQRSSLKIGVENLVEFSHSKLDSGASFGEGFTAAHGKHCGFFAHRKEF